MFGFSLLPGWLVDGVRRVRGALIVQARSRRRSGRCPACRCSSARVHGYHRRRPADLPIMGRPVVLDLRIRRYACTNAACHRRTFSEAVPALVAPHARCTRRLVRAQTRIGVALGGEAGRRLTRHLAMAVSGDTLLRLVRAAPARAAETPAIIGVDDWALKKRHRYGTLIVDLERRRIVDLLPDRSASTLAAWLDARSAIRVVARDRSTEYTRAISAAAPSAMQVADRWHLLFNAQQVVERWASSAYGRLRRLPTLAAVDDVSLGRAGAFVRTRADAAIAGANQARRRAKHEEVRRRHLAGEPLRSISRATGLARATVRRYALAEACPERASGVPRPSIIDPYLPYLASRVAEGCDNAEQLWRGCRDQGFSGTAKQIRRWLQAQRTTPHPHTPFRWRDIPLRDPSLPRAGPIPSPKHLAWLLVKAPEKLSPEEAEAVLRIDQDVEAARLIGLIRRFAEIIREGSARSAAARDAAVAGFEAWLGEATSCGIRALETFASGLAQDRAAVRAALASPWSNAQAEGQINKLKLLKRSMYGRAKLDLLRQRLMIAA